LQQNQFQPWYARTSLHGRTNCEFYRSPWSATPRLYAVEQSHGEQISPVHLRISQSLLFSSFSPCKPAQCDYQRVFYSAIITGSDGFCLFGSPSVFLLRDPNLKTKTHKQTEIGANVLQHRSNRCALFSLHMSCKWLADCALAAIAGSLHTGRSVVGSTTDGCKHVGIRLPRSLLVYYHHRILKSTLTKSIGQSIGKVLPANICR